MREVLREKFASVPKNAAKSADDATKKAPNEKTLEALEVKIAKAGLEPARPSRARDFKSPASAIPPLGRLVARRRTSNAGKKGKRPKRTPSASFLIIRRLASTSTARNALSTFFGKFFIFGDARRGRVARRLGKLGRAGETAKGERGLKNGVSTATRLVSRAQNGYNGERRRAKKRVEPFWYWAFAV